MRYLLFFMLTSMCLGSPPRVYLDLMEDVWDSGLVCRHAAAALSVQASFDALPFKVLRYSVQASEEPHIVFLLEYQRDWYVIDGVKTGANHTAVWGKMSRGWNPARSASTLSFYTQRPLIKFLQEIDSDTLECWLDEDLCHKTMYKED